jgi:hypothetical protein
VSLWNLSDVKLMPMSITGCRACPAGSTTGTPRRAGCADDAADNDDDDEEEDAMNTR